MYNSCTHKSTRATPQVYMDVAINGTHIGRVEVVLFVKEAPRCAENFRQLFTGQLLWGCTPLFAELAFFCWAGGRGRAGPRRAAPRASGGSSLVNAIQ